MFLLRKTVAVALAFCLYHLSLVKSLSAATPFHPATVRQQVSEFGVGARVGLKLAGGEKLRGSISAIDDQGLVLSEHKRAVRRIAYDEVAQLRLAERAYRAKGETDPAAARRIVVSLGMGRHAVVKFAGRELHGHIQAIEADHFTLLPDRATAPVRIAYSEVRYVEKNLSLGATIVLIVLIAAAAVVAASVAATRN